MQSFFVQGIGHITDMDGYDHMLFLLALCAPYSFRSWKSVVLIATAFTVGHSISLGLAATGVIQFNRDLVELLISVTILLTAISNIFLPVKEEAVPVRVYLVTACFGLIHGMGFSSYFKMILDQSSSIVKPLFLFNLGVEAGQIIIIALILALLALIAWIPVIGPRRMLVFSVISGILASWLIASWCMENMEIFQPAM